MTDDLMGLSKQQLARVPIPDDIAGDVEKGKKITTHIALKRHKGLIAKQLRFLQEEELVPIQRVLEAFKTGSGSATAGIDPVVDDMVGAGG